MGLTREDAYELLELPVGADQDSIRTSYKRLAQKWHPDKHSGNSNSVDATKRFKGVSKAFKRLAGEQNDEKSVSAMTMDEMMRQFKEVCFARTVYQYNGGSGCDTSEDDSDEDDDIDEEFQYQNLFPDKFKVKHDFKKSKSESLSNHKHLTPEEIDKNAMELITEEEKEKRRIEKRKAKKKRRREKKKLEKEGVANNEEEDSPKSKDKENKDKIKSKKKNDSSSSDEADFDPNSAFFTKVKNKKKKSQLQATDALSRKDKKGGSEDEGDELDPVVLRSRQLAIKGNEMAQLGHYTAAIELFTEAIKLDPHDFRFFGNRSYCFDRTQQYDRALKDAEKAINLSKDWPKGYFRKGRALAGLRKYSEAEDAFTQVLKLDKNCEDAVTELLRVRTYQITDMGFSRQQAEAAIKLYGTVQAALDSLLASVAENTLGSKEVYVSDEEEGFTQAPPQTNHRHINQKSAVDGKMDPRNAEGLTALWVGNVLPDKVDDKKLLRIFSKYGSVTSVRCLPEKFCAFINYKTKEAAGKAMVHLQGAECGGQKLLIKFPDNPIVNGSGNTTIRKTQQQKPHQQAVTLVGSKAASAIAASKESPKQSGPVNGDECYFWRTTGCMYGDKCKYKHVSNQQGVDKKPWQKS